MTQEPEARRLCRCHGEPMYMEGRRANGSHKWRCAVRKAAWERARFSSPDHREYNRARCAARYDDPTKRIQDYMTKVVNNAGRKLDHSRQRAQELYT